MLVKWDDFKCFSCLNDARAFYQDTSTETLRVFRCLLGNQNINQIDPKGVTDP